MQLSEYMAERRLGDAEVAEAIGRSRATVSRYRRGKMRPDWDALQSIAKFTAGEVSPNDWLEAAE